MGGVDFFQNCLAGRVFNLQLGAPYYSVRKSMDVSMQRSLETVKLLWANAKLLMRYNFLL